MDVAHTLFSTRVERLTALIGPPNEQHLFGVVWNLSPDAHVTLRRKSGSLALNGTLLDTRTSEHLDRSIAHIAMVAGLPHRELSFDAKQRGEMVQELCRNANALADELETVAQTLGPLGRDAIEPPERRILRAARDKIRVQMNRLLTGREPIPTDVKKAVWERDKGRCVLCGSRRDLHFDHEVPVVEGGDNSVANIRVLCRSCNLKKSAKIE